MNKILTPLNSAIELPYLNGKQTLADSRRLFPSHFDQEYYNLGMKSIGRHSKQGIVRAHGLNWNAASNAMFRSLSGKLEDAVLTQNQWTFFCESKQGQLYVDGLNLVLFRKDERKEATPSNLAIAKVLVESNGLAIFFFNFVDRNLVWRKEDNIYVFAPQAPGQRAC